MSVPHYGGKNEFTSYSFRVRCQNGRGEFGAGARELSGWADPSIRRFSKQLESSEPKSRLPTARWVHSTRGRAPQGPPRTDRGELSFGSQKPRCYLCATHLTMDENQTSPHSDEPMDYKTGPDIPREGRLELRHLVLFHRFRQKADTDYIGERFKDEFERHLKLCETAILHAARAGFYWCELPVHPWLELNPWVQQALEDSGFEVKMRAPNRASRPKEQKAEEKTIPVAEWFYRVLHFRDESVSAEWARRDRLEQEERARRPVTQRSVRVGDKLEQGETVWCALLDGRYVVEVQRIVKTPHLCIFDETKTCIFSEATSVSYGAQFGPDDSDVRDWEERALEVIEGLKKRGDPQSG